MGKGNGLSRSRLPSVAFKGGEMGSTWSIAVRELI